MTRPNCRGRPASSVDESPLPQIWNRKSWVQFALFSLIIHESPSFMSALKMEDAYLYRWKIGHRGSLLLTNQMRRSILQYLPQPAIVGVASLEKKKDIRALLNATLLALRNTRRRINSAKHSRKTLLSLLEFGSEKMRRCHLSDTYVLTQRLIHQSVCLKITSQSVKCVP